jgi:hypothetical protein
MSVRYFDRAEELLDPPLWGIGDRAWRLLDSGLYGSPSGEARAHFPLPSYFAAHALRRRRAPSGWHRVPRTRRPPNKLTKARASLLGAKR